MEGTNKLFEASGGSCGGSEEKTSGAFSQLIGAGKSANIYFPMLNDTDYCWALFPFDCSNTAQFDTFRAENKVAE